MSSEQTHSELHRQLFTNGIKVRKEVLGHEHVETSLSKVTPYTQPGHELVTEWAWGNIWQRPGLDRKQRSLLSKFYFLADARARLLNRTH
jgi:4-carboxymuconolactone decarboxylase